MLHWLAAKLQFIENSFYNTTESIVLWKQRKCPEKTNKCSNMKFIYHSAPVFRLIKHLIAYWRHCAGLQPLAFFIQLSYRFVFFEINVSQCGLFRLKKICSRNGVRIFWAFFRSYDIGEISGFWDLHNILVPLKCNENIRNYLYRKQQSTFKHGNTESNLYQFILHFQHSLFWEGNDVKNCIFFLLCLFKRYIRLLKKGGKVRRGRSKTIKENVNTQFFWTHKYRHDF